MSHHIVTVCMFCLLCAAHSTCGAHISTISETNDPMTIVKFDQTQRSLPFDLADFQTISQDHEIRKKNLSDEKKMRYLQKLSKIRSHRAEKTDILSEFSDSYKLETDGSEHSVREADGSKRSVREADGSVRLNPSAYVKQLFSMYGDADSMTMNVSGLNAMLRELDLMKMVEGGRAEHRKPDYVYKNGHEEDVNHTCVNSADLITTVNSRLKPEHEHHESHEEPLLNEVSLQAICPIILYQKLANTSHERQGCVIDRERTLSERISSVANPTKAYTTRRVEVWVYSSLSIFFISACGLLGVAVVPIMHKNYYNHIMQFLIALAIGTLGGDAFLHLIPHALSAGHSHGGSESEHSHNDGMWKGLAAMMGVVFFYFTEKGLTVIAEFRKRRQKKEENKLPSRVRVLQDEGTSGCNKPISTSSANSFLKIFNSKCKKQEDPDTKMCKHKYSEYPYCYDEITTDTHDHHHHRDGQIPPSPKGKKNNSVSVVSSNNLSDKESEPTAKDWLLNYMDEDKKEGTQKDGVELNNIKHKDGEVNKDLKDEESYTVILREHSRAHHGHSHSHGHVHAPPSSLSSVVWMVIMGDGLHNFTDGMAIGAAFASNIAVGFSTAIAVLCHELPHELGDFAVLLKAGMSVRRAIFYNILSSVLCIAGMVCGVLVGHAPAATSWVFAVAAGLFIYIALADLVPELSSSHSKEGTFCQCMLQLLGLCTGIGIMLLIALYEHDLEKLFG